MKSEPDYIRQRGRAVLPIATLIVGLAAGYFVASMKTQSELDAAVHFQVALEAQQKAQIVKTLREGRLDDTSRLLQEFLKSDLVMLEAYLPNAGTDRVAFFQAAITNAKIAVK